MSATAKFTQFLRTQPPAPRADHGERDDPRPTMEAKLALAKARPVVHALLATLLERDTSFALFDIAFYPTVLARAPREKGVMSEREMCVARNGAGDLYLWNVDDDSVRLVIHDEDWLVRTTSRTFDGFLEGALWTCLELVQVEDVDDFDAAERARIRFAVDLVGIDPLDDEVRERLTAVGILGERGPSPA